MGLTVSTWEVVHRLGYGRLTRPEIITQRIFGIARNFVATVWQQWNYWLEIWGPDAFNLK
jgi:hypothetical protein